jgi:uncharacterized membrane protein
MNRHNPAKLLLLLLLPAFIVSFSTKSYKANYTGTWKLSEQKSDLGEFGGRIAPKKIKAEQKDDAIAIARTGTGFDGSDYTTNETLTFDGKTAETTVFESSKKKSTIKWSEDGNSFVITYVLVLNFNGETSEINGTEAWSLSEDGKTLTAQTKSTSPQGEFAMKAVYEKE